MQPEITIDQALEAFLDDQRARLSARTMRNYDEVIGLFRDCLEGYGPNTLSGDDRKRWQEVFNAGDADAFCHVLGPEHILENVSEFLGYYMIRKVGGGQELLRAAGTVTKKLAAWLHEQHYISEDDKDDAVTQGTEAARDLPRAERLASLLYEQSRHAPSLAQLAPGDLLEDHLTIERIEPEALYFTGGIGPLPVSAEASALAEVGWRMNVTLARFRGVWSVAEIGNVYP